MEFINENIGSYRANFVIFTYIIFFCVESKDLYEKRNNTRFYCMHHTYLCMKMARHKFAYFSRTFQFPYPHVGESHIEIASFYDLA